MRAFLVAFSAAALATLAGCSTPVPLTPDGAWTVNIGFVSGCTISDSTRSLGEVTTSHISTPVDDGSNGASIDCSVSGTGPFTVNASASSGDDILDILIPSLAAGATAANPAIGSVSYQSDATVATYSSSSCNFYFANGSEGVAAGQVWVAFTCPTIANGGGMSTCAVTGPSVALFENCLTTM